MIESPGKVRGIQWRVVVIALLVLGLLVIAVLFVFFPGLFQAELSKADSEARSADRISDAVVQIAWRLPGTMAWRKTLPIGKLPEGSLTYAEDMKEMFKLNWEHVRTAPGGDTCNYVIKYWNGSDYITHKTVSVEDSSSIVLLDKPAIEVCVFPQGINAESDNHDEP
ncbi:hypothetical protein Mal52_43740 [Symmachiella dynata]|uniref:Uncharacterized protein n=1 Tax=Symmachiella dynata TaxID=2527995 RepID=A0A517ZTS8_9PLAN|nr:hypothetical protein [Symmachiella dynata]QDU45877.1 hypothetical protein Mal52_43740 [Symmachiella dynata]